MFNFFQEKRKRRLNAQKSKPKKVSGQNSQKRINSWCCSLEPKSAQALNKGVIPIDHPSNHQFRTREKTKELSGSIYIRKCMTSRDRAHTEATNYRKAYLNEVYNPNSPHTHQNWLRPTNPNSRLNTKSRELPKREIESEPLECKEYANPTWRIDQKNKWVGKNFVFSKVPKKDEFFAKDPYLGGFEETGDLTRKRNKSREVGKSNFSIRRNIESISTIDSIRNHQESRYGSLLNTKNYPKSCENLIKSLKKH